MSKSQWRPVVGCGELAIMLQARCSKVKQGQGRWGGGGSGDGESGASEH